MVRLASRSRRTVRPSGIGGAFTSAHTVGTGLVIGALALTVAALLIPVSLFDPHTALVAGPGGRMSTIDDDGLGTMNTQYGPLTSLDREFVRKVRQAGLWEGPAGREAIQRGSTPEFREVGEHLVMGHTELDDMAMETATELGIPQMPNQPTAQQQEFLDAFSRAADGAEYETLAANTMRRAHGQVFVLVAQVRATTQNSLVRDLADKANETVLDHITVLEATGLIDYDALS
jgi:predicted outer membrane protein